VESVRQDAAFVESMLDRIEGLLLHKLQEIHACSPALRHDLGDSNIFPVPVRAQPRAGTALARRGCEVSASWPSGAGCSPVTVLRLATAAQAHRSLLRCHEL